MVNKIITHNQNNYNHNHNNRNNNKKKKKMKDLKQHLKILIKKRVIKNF